MIKRSKKEEKYLKNMDGLTPKDQNIYTKGKLV